MLKFAIQGIRYKVFPKPRSQRNDGSNQFLLSPHLTVSMAPFLVRYPHSSDTEELVGTGRVETTRQQTKEMDVQKLIITGHGKQ